ncbi:DUF4912 domain-containing protein [Bacillus sp. P14.5]|uniref:DUF4912 domain-containing protein n=1 Tax=Bacillus sp. P14.5 TaxID=1983400 RepID=UPI000DEA913E|nr:DUF4912 domain-containing protein [Bacillus sp. P14.5]
MLEQIIEYRNQGLSFRKIAKEMDTTVGKVQYQWVKYQKALEESQAVVAAASEITGMRPKHKRQGKYKGRVFNKNTKTKMLKSKMTAVFSDVTRILCYWNIPETIIKQVKGFHGLKEEQSLYCLRVFDITSISFNGHNHHSHTDIIIHPHSTHWFINSLQPNRSYCVEYGIVSQAGRFTGIVRSNVIQTARTGHGQDYHPLEVLQDFEAGRSKSPQWVEHVSTYSYYL